MTDTGVGSESCPAELTCAMYADGELSASEAKLLREHLDRCPRCRERVLAFQAERETLVGFLGDADAFLAESEPVPVPASSHVPVPASSPVPVPASSLLPVPASSPILVLRLMGLIFGTALLLRMGLDLVTGLQLPWGLAWLNPLQVSGQLSLLFSSCVYFIREGGSIMESLMITAGITALLGTLVYLIFVEFQRSARSARSSWLPVMLGTLILAFIAAPPAKAIEIKSGENVSIEANEVIDDTFVAFGRTVRIDGVVTGDLIAFAESIDIQGSVHGDAFFFGQNIEIEGKVDGGIGAFGEVIRLGNTVGQSVYGFGKSILSRRDAAIGGDLFAFGDQINVGGSVGRNVTVFGNRLTVSGKVLRDVTFSGRVAAIQSSASIGGNLDVELPSEEDLLVVSGSSVAGTTSIDVYEERQEEAGSFWSFWSFWSLLFSVLWLAAAFISGMLVFWALPAFKSQPLEDIRSILVSAGTGVVILIALPVAAAVFAVTLIGLPVGLVTMVVWAVGLYLSKIVVAHYLGTALLRSKQQDMRSVALALSVGLVLVLVAVSLPYVGWVINGLLVILGLGAMSQILYRVARNRTAVA